MKAKDLYSWYLHGERVFSEKFVRVSEAARQRQGLVFRSLNMKDFANEVQNIHELYTRGWTANWGEVPLTDEEFDYMAADLKAIVNPVLCKGDGLCNAKCPTGAIQLKHFTDKGLFAQIDALVPYK